MSSQNKKRKRDEHRQNISSSPLLPKKQKVECDIKDDKSPNKFDSLVMNDKLRKELEEIVKECMKHFDASHDFYHVERVRNLAIKIAKTEGIKDLELVELAALLHDVNDHKYITNNSNTKVNNDKIKAILNKYKISAEKQNKMNLIIDNMSFSKEIKIKNDEQDKENYSKYLLLIQNNPEMGCVQDADRLDAIGAIGIARTFCFGAAKKGRALFNYPLKSNMDNEPRDDINHWIQNKKCNGTTIAHFYDKLFLLRDLMKTKTGKQIAIQRHQTMQRFVHSFLNEWDGN